MASFDTPSPWYRRYIPRNGHATVSSRIGENNCFATSRLGVGQNCAGKIFSWQVLRGSVKMCNFVRKTMQMSGIDSIFRSVQEGVPSMEMSPILDAARFFYPCHEGHIPPFLSSTVAGKDIYLILYYCCFILFLNSFSLCASYLFFC